MTRILTALILLAILWPVTEAGSAWAFLALAGGLIAAAVWECARLMAHLGWRPFVWLSVVASVALLASFSPIGPSFGPGLPLAAVVILAPILAMWTRDDTRGMVEAVVATVFPVVFVGLTLGQVVRLRAVPGEDGRDLVYLLFVCVILADTAAFYVGTTLGRNRMAPRISPKKSWEGTAGGVLASIGAAVLAHFWFFQRLPLTHALAIGALLGVASVFGDLSESMLKRAAGVKDSSSLLPGHGGVLDRADSVIFAAPILYYYWTWVLARSL
jgi:phosphatidate cytidylyltransferase